MFHNRSFSLKPVNSFLTYKMLFSCRLLLDSLQAICQLARSTFGNCRQHQSISHFLRLLIELGVPQDSPPFLFRHFYWCTYIVQIKLILRIAQEQNSIVQLFSKSLKYLKSINCLSFALLKVEKLLDLFCILCIVKVNRLQAKQLSYWKYFLQGLANSSRGNAEEGRIKLLLSGDHIWFFHQTTRIKLQNLDFILCCLSPETLNICLQRVKSWSRLTFKVGCSDNGSLIPRPGLSGHQLPGTSGAASSETEGKRKLIPC